MTNLPTYDDDQDGGIRLQMATKPDCPECGNTGISAHAIDPRTGKSIRTPCHCAWTKRSHRNVR